MSQEPHPPTAGGPPPDAILMQMLFAPIMQQCITIATKLKIADLLAKGPLPVTELAAKTDTNADALYRMLRLLSSAGIFSQKDNKFELTPMAALLRSDVPESMYSFALMMGEDWMWRNWGELMYSIKTGKPSHEKVTGMSSFEFFAANKSAGTVFNNAMTNLSKTSVGPVVDAYDFSHAGTIVDIAGGHGMLLAGVLKANPGAKGVLFDLPGVIEGAGSLLEKEGVTDRVDLVPGDFFKSVPAGADLYMMRHIIHDWDDASSTKILKHIRSAMNRDGKVLIIEMVVPNNNEPSPSKIMDMMMIIMEGGKERTEEEYRALLASADLKLTRVIATKSPYSLVEAECM